jgi:maleate isomerase
LWRLSVPLKYSGIAMSVAYAPKGLVGVFTPQANTTVEPEMAMMTPPGMAFLNARMTSTAGTIPERLLDYMSQFPAQLSQFANAPLDAVAIACTGASYLLGKDAEDALLASITQATGRPAITGATASLDALSMLGAKRIGLVSPYNSALDAESAGYWRSRGLDVVAEVSAFRETDAFHPIYSLDAAAAAKALQQLEGENLDAVLMLGTGMPTLDAIAAQPFLGKAPVLSCMLCIGWRAAALASPDFDSKESLLDWIKGGTWKAALGRSRAP